MRLTSILQLFLLCLSSSLLVLAEEFYIELEASALSQYGTSDTALQVDVGDVLKLQCRDSGVAIFRMTSESEFTACAGTEANVRELGKCVGLPNQAITESIRHIPENVASNLDYSPETTYFFAGFSTNGLNMTHPSGPPCSNGLKMAMSISALPSLLTDPPPTQDGITTRGLNNVIGGNRDGGDSGADLPFPMFVIYIFAAGGGIIVISIICFVIFLICFWKWKKRNKDAEVEEGATSSGTHYTDPKSDKKDSKKSKAGLPKGGSTPPAAHQSNVTKGSVKESPKKESKKESKKDLTKKDTKKLGPANKSSPNSKPGPSKTRTKAPVAPGARVETDSSLPPADTARASINKNNVSFHKNGSAPTTTTTGSVAPNSSLRTEAIAAKKQAGSKVSPKDPIVTLSVTPNTSIPTTRNSSAASGSSKLRDRAKTEHFDSPKNPAKKSSAGTRGAPGNKLGANGGGGGAGKTNYGQRAPAPPAPLSSTRSLTITDRPPVSRQHQPVSSSLIPTGAGKR